jgi:hypothetical protein
MREEYIQMRQKGNYDINWFYKYYLQEGGSNISLSDFYHIFTSYDLDSILMMIDYRYGLTKLYDKNNNLMKVVE